MLCKVCHYGKGDIYMNELYHHGIHGQKWGVRRYQNSDGTLTPEGRERYRKNITKFGNIGAGIGAASVAGMTAIGVASGLALGVVPIISLPALTTMMSTYAISGYATGATVGAIKGSVEVLKGRKYVNQHTHSSSHRRR